MRGQHDGIALIQLQTDLLAAALADALRRSGNFTLIEPAPGEPAMLDALAANRALEPVVIIVGQSPSLEARAQAFAAARPDLVVVTVPLGGGRLILDIPAPAFDDLTSLLRWLSSRGKEMRIGVEGPDRYAQKLDATGQMLPPPRGEGPGPLSRTWLDAVLRLAMARMGVSDEVSLPGLTVSASAAQGLLSRQSHTDADELAALEEDRDVATADLTEALTDGSGEERLGRLVRRFGLQSVEWQALLLMLAPELDPIYQRVFGVLHDDLGRRSATLGLIGTMLGAPGEFGSQIRRMLAEAGGLARWWLTEPRLGPAVSAADPLQVDPAIRAWLIEGGIAQASDPRLSGWIRPAPWPGAEAVDALPEAAQLTEVLRHDCGWAVLTGGHAEDWRALAESAARQASLPLLRIVPPRGGALDAQQAQEIAVRIARAADLFGFVPAIAADAETDEAQLASVIGHLATAGLSGPVVLLAPGGAVPGVLADAAKVVLSFTPMSASARAGLFKAQAAHAGIELGDEAVARLAASSRLPPSMIAGAMKLARAKAAGKPGGEPAREVVAACREIAMPRLPRHARVLTPMFDLSQVVLPPDRHAQLHEIVAQIRNTATVLDQWGFGAQLPAGRAVAALLWGPSGTGKTMAAQAVARELDTDLYVVDLASVMSKYIGETEKNLDAVFDEAERAGVALLFDEADALFAKRGEVRDAHDRYANIEVAFLLQRLESFAGLAILTTNFRQNIDSAFLRRIRFAIEFPRPDAAARELIWRQCLPVSAPLAPDLDLAAVARRIELTGGNIRQVTLRAAFAAAAAGVPIATQHIMAAARAELMKLGMPSAANALPLASIKADAA
jgi:hypothetical protein